MQEEARRRRERYAAELAAQIAADQAARRTAWQSAQRRPGPGLGSRLPTPERSSERRAWPGRRRYDAAPDAGASSAAREGTGAAGAATGAGDPWAGGQQAGSRSREATAMESAERAQAHAELGRGGWGSGQVVEPMRPEQALPNGPSELQHAGQAAAAPALQHGAHRSGLLHASSDGDLRARYAAAGGLDAVATQPPLYPSRQGYGPQAPMERSSQHAGYPAGHRRSQPGQLQGREQGFDDQQALPVSAARPHQATRLDGLPDHAEQQRMLPGHAVHSDGPLHTWALNGPPPQAAQPGNMAQQGARPGALPGHAARPVRTPMYRRRSSVRMAQAGLEPGNGALAASGQQAARLRQQAAYRYALGGACEHCLIQISTESALSRQAPSPLLQHLYSKPLLVKARVPTKTLPAQASITRYN